MGLQSARPGALLVLIALFAWSISGWLAIGILVFSAVLTIALWRYDSRPNKKPPRWR